MMFYEETKVYFDGSHYIAIPHTTMPKKKRVKLEEEKVVVVEKCKDMGEDVEKEDALSNNDEMDDVFGDLIPVDENLEIVRKPEISLQNSTNARTATRSEIFDELYEEALKLPKKKRRNFIKNGMRPYFKTEVALENYVETKITAKKKNIMDRKRRFIRKAYMNKFNYFVTFTYDDKKMDETTFRKKLGMCLANFQKRRGWRYMGVWERAPESKRLHFHGLLWAPDDTMPGEFVKTKDYSFNTHKMEIMHQNTYFIERFGRNDFEELDEDLLKMGNAMAYILKYIEKSHEKIVYSRGLPMYFISDISDDDVICLYGLEDKKLLLFDDFTCYDEGVEIGVISPETKKELRHSN